MSVVDYLTFDQINVKNIGAALGVSTLIRLCIPSMSFVFWYVFSYYYVSRIMQRNIGWLESTFIIQYLAMLPFFYITGLNSSVNNVSLRESFLWVLNLLLSLHIPLVLKNIHFKKLIIEHYAFQKLSIEEKYIVKTWIFVFITMVLYNCVYFSLKSLMLYSILYGSMTAVTLFIRPVLELHLYNYILAMMCLPLTSFPNSVSLYFAAYWFSVYVHQVSKDGMNWMLWGRAE